MSNSMIRTSLASELGRRLRERGPDLRAHALALLQQHFAGRSVIRGQGTPEKPWTIVVSAVVEEPDEELFICILYEEAGALWSKQWGKGAHPICSLRECTSLEGVLP